MLMQLHKRSQRYKLGANSRETCPGHAKYCGKFSAGFAANDPEFDLEAALDDFVTFFVAGQETTASTMSFVLMEIGRHPEVLRK